MCVCVCVLPLSASLFPLSPSVYPPPSPPLPPPLSQSAVPSISQTLSVFPIKFQSLVTVGLLYRRLSQRWGHDPGFCSLGLKGLLD